MRTYANEDMEIRHACMHVCSHLARASMNTCAGAVVCPIQKFKPPLPCFAVFVYGRQLRSWLACRRDLSCCCGCETRAGQRRVKWASAGREKPVSRAASKRTAEAIHAQISVCTGKNAEHEHARTQPFSIKCTCSRCANS